MGHTGQIQLLFYLAMLSVASAVASCDIPMADWRVIAEAQNSTFPPPPTRFAVVMQITDAIGDYAKHFIDITSAWCKERAIPIYIFTHLPGGNHSHPTPEPMDSRFGKVGLLAATMRRIREDGSDVGYLFWVDR